MHAHSPRRLGLAATLAVAATVVACSGDSTTTPNSTPGAVTLSVASSSVPGVSPTLYASGSARVTDAAVNGAMLIVRGADTLQIDSVNVVFARVVLRQAADTSCGGDGHDDGADHQCAELKDGPILVSLPMTAGAKTVFDVPAPAGTYTGISLRTHKPRRDDSGPNVQAFLAQHPEYENTSIRVVGRFRGVAFSWRGDPEAKVDMGFSPPLTVSGSTGLNLTLKIDVATWFTGANGNLLDPRTTSYPQIAQNIKNSFKAFEDASHTGRDDHH